MRRSHGSLYDVRTAGFKANLSDVLAAIALCQLDKIDAHAEIRRRHVEAYDAAVADLRGYHAARARPARPPRAPPLRRPDRPGGRGRRPRRLPARARRGEHRHEHPLPPGAHADVLPRALPRPAAASRRGAGRARGALPAAFAGALGRGHRGRGGRAAPCPRPLHRRCREDQPAGSHRSAGARQRGRPRLPDLADRPRRDDRPDRVEQRLVPARLVRDLPRDDRGDGLALEGASGLEGDPRAALLADEALLRRLCGRAGAAHVHRRRRRAHRRTRAPQARREGGGRGRGSHGARRRLRGDARPRRDRSRARDRALQQHRRRS